MPKRPSPNEALSVLRGLRLRSVGRVIDMLWMHFGDYRTYLDERGKPREVGEWALHVQCPWRFARADSITLGNADCYFNSKGDEPYNFDGKGESRFDRRAAQFNHVLESGNFLVSAVTVGWGGAFALEFSADFQFAALPHASDHSPRGEFWRLFRPDRDESHYVVSPEGIPER